MTTGQPRYSTWHDRFAADFARLNRAWLEGHDLLEDGDLKYLDDPRGAIIEHGGEVFVATVDGVLVGTCGIVPADGTRAELVKLTTDARVRGLGIGTHLTRMALDWARRRRLSVVYLVSSTKQTDAIRLYERLGFRHAPMPPDPGYVTADVYMEYEVDVQSGPA